MNLGPFSPAMLEELRARFSRIERVDPEVGAYVLLCKTLDSMDNARLQQLADAGIKFLSKLAQNRIRARSNV